VALSGDAILGGLRLATCSVRRTQAHERDRVAPLSAGRTVTQRRNAGYHPFEGWGCSGAGTVFPCSAAKLNSDRREKSKAHFCRYARANALPSSGLSAYAVYMTPSDQRYYRFLVEALRLVAAKASVQKSSVNEDALVTDEIKAYFAMAYLYVEQLARIGLLSREALRALAPIHGWIRMDVDPDVYFPESLSRHPYWANGRRLAQRALKLIGEKPKPPDLSQCDVMRFQLDESNDA
jgi:hypothetical protein